MSLTDVSVKQPQLADLGPVLKEWTRIIGEYCAVMEDDVPYWHNERADVSILAGAVWRRGGICLEEPATRKARGRSKRPGRADLLFALDGRYYVGEAKRTGATLGSCEAVQRVQNCLESACQDVRRYQEDADVLRLGIAFVVPHLVESRVDCCASLVKGFLDSLSDIAMDFAAWTFPKIEPAVHTWKRYLHPGVVLLGKIQG